MMMISQFRCLLRNWDGLVGGFIPYDTDIVFDGDMQFKYVYESIREHGSFQVWLEHVKQLRKSGRMEIKFYLAASFASVLVGTSWHPAVHR